MYLDDEANGKKLGAEADLTGNPESRLWINCVLSTLYTVRQEWPAVDSFLDSMERLGEPFLFGVPVTGDWLGRFGLKLEADQDAVRWFPELAGDPVYSMYRFVVASGRRGSDHER